MHCHLTGKILTVICSPFQLSITGTLQRGRRKASGRANSTELANPAQVPATMTVSGLQHSTTTEGEGGDANTQREQEQAVPIADKMELLAVRC